MPDMPIDEGTGVVQPISPVATSTTAFVGRTAKGSPDAPRTITSTFEMDQVFGPPSPAFPVTAAVRDYFENGGMTAVIVNGVSTGLHALRGVAFNLLCIPPDTEARNTSPAMYAEALRACTDARAILLIDAPAVTGAPPAAGIAGVAAGVEALRSALDSTHLHNAALYHPRLETRDSQGYGPARVPCGAVAGVIARIDRQRGVWKAPAGADAALAGVHGLSATLNDSETAQLSALGINCLRSFPGRGAVIWGARTLAAGSGGDFKYLPVRRLALYIEASVDRGTAWAASEPNAEPAWTALRASIEAFMLGLFRDGALAGRTPREAFFVRCGRDTATQNDIDAGIMNIEIGFAPLRPAEFVTLRVQRMLTGSG